VSYKLLVIDLDGTLLDKNGDISITDRQALSRVRESGIRISLSTGRAAKACSKIIGQLALDGFHVFFDGALVYNFQEDEEIYSQPIDAQTVKAASEFALNNGIPLELYSTDRYYVMAETRNTGIQSKFFGIDPVVTDFTTLWKRERILKGGLITSNTEEAAGVRGFSQRFADKLNFSWATTPAYPGWHFINVITPGVSKGKALHTLASHLDIKLGEVMAIGDGANDLSLLSAAGLAIAMHNASDEIKAIADFITGDVQQNGVSQAINKFLL
jgi:Cof subfamily protein (haloacid dehalogenase superfamily)